VIRPTGRTELFAFEIRISGKGGSGDEEFRPRSTPESAKNRRMANGKARQRDPQTLLEKSAYPQALERIRGFGEKTPEYSA
jgi:hypothetical protein